MSKCPNCGYCEACGRSNVLPYSPYFMPYNPQVVPYYVPQYPPNFGPYPMVTNNASN